jgi:hypothetical protein
MLIFRAAGRPGHGEGRGRRTGFGLKPQPPEGPGTLFVYDVGGAKVAEAAASHDGEIARPVPLQVVTKDGKSRLYVGRHSVEIQ